MATAVPEVGRSGLANDTGDGNITRPWFVHHATTEKEAILAVAAEAPETIEGLVLSNISFSEEVKEGYRCTAQYGMFKRRPAPQVGESQFNFEIATQSQRVVVPLREQVVYRRPGDPAPEDSSRWLIGQQADKSQPEGVEVFEPNASFSETHWVDASIVTAEYQKGLLAVVGKLNQEDFRSWSAEEILCTGISGSKRGAADWEISFRFSIREHQEGLSIAGISGVNKKGWQYLWPRYELKADSTASILSNVIKYIVVADVFEIADYSALGITAE